MADRDYLNIGDFTRFPLRADSDPAFAGGGALPRRGLADAGFMLGQDAEFDAAVHGVFLYAVIRTAGDLQLDFRSDAPGLTDRRWLFVFPNAALLYGATAQVDMTPVPSGAAEPDSGWGFLTLGDPTDLAALAADTHLLADAPAVEPALLQNLADAGVRSLNIANTARRCPPVCSCDPSSSSSSSSSSSGAPFTDESIIILQKNLQGGIRIDGGYNVDVRIDASLNAVELGAAPGAGRGPTCIDYLIDEDGLRVDEGDDCDSCGRYIRSINGRVFPAGRVRLDGGAGTRIVPDADRHRLTVVQSPDFICGASSSSA